MCGIVGVVAECNAVPILIEGLRRLEYRGYDSAGLAVLTPEHQLARLRTVGKGADGVTVIQMPATASALQAPVLFAVPLQLLAYHVAVLNGTDVDQPRNLSKSLTVE